MEYYIYEANSMLSMVRREWVTFDEAEKYLSGLKKGLTFGDIARESELKKLHQLFIDCFLAVEPERSEALDKLKELGRIVDSRYSDNV